MDNRAKEIVNTIHTQLIALGRSKVVCWGAQSWMNGVTPDKNKNPFLLFYVNGLLYKGWVMILYSWDDTYTVRLVKKNETFFDVTKEKTDVYFDEMVDLIDGWVEYTGDDESYRKKVINEGLFISNGSFCKTNNN